MIFDTFNRFPGNWKHHFRLTPIRETQRMRSSKKLQKINRSILLKADSMIWPPKLSKLNGSMWSLNYYCRVSKVSLSILVDLGKSDLFKTSE